MIAPATKFVIATIGLVISVGLPATQANETVIREKSGDVGCIVVPPASRSAKADADRISIDIHVPLTPSMALLGKLPAARRDFSALPITVYLIQAPAKGEVATGKLAVVLPTSLDFTFKRLGRNSHAEADTFVRVEYPREALRGGLDLVAERTSIANDGERITAQTRCRISSSDAQAWK